MPRRNPYGWTFCPIASLYSVPSPVEPVGVVQNFKFTRNCLLRGLFGCRLLGSGLCGCLLGCGLCRSFGGCLLRGLFRCRGWSGIGGCADGSDRLLLSDSDDDVCEPALVAEGTAHRCRADTLHPRAFVCDGGADVEVV